MKEAVDNRELTPVCFSSKFVSRSKSVYWDFLVSTSESLKLVAVERKKVQFVVQKAQITSLSLGQVSIKALKKSRIWCNSLLFSACNSSNNLSWSLNPLNLNP